MKAINYLDCDVGAAPAASVSAKFSQRRTETWMAPGCAAGGPRRLGVGEGSWQRMPGRPVGPSSSGEVANGPSANK